MVERIDFGDLRESSTIVSALCPQLRQIDLGVATLKYEGGGSELMQEAEEAVQVVG